MKEKTLAVLCHVGGLVGSLFFPGLGGTMVALSVWAFGKAPDRELFNQHAKEVTNFHLSIFIYLVGISLLAMVIFFMGGAFLLGVDPMTMSDSFETMIAPGIVGALSLSILVPMLIGLVIVIYVIAAIANAIGGKECHYPLTIRLIK